MSKYVEITVEQSRGATYAHETFAIYGHKYHDKHSVCYAGPGSTYRCHLAGGYETAEAALEAARLKYPGEKISISGSTYEPYNPPSVAPAWFDESYAGETW